MQPNVEPGSGWMAWTWQTAVFFGVIALLLVVMGVWEWRSPGGGPRRGILGLVTTRGDRLFISLLAAGYIHLLWLALLRRAAVGRERGRGFAGAADLSIRLTLGSTEGAGTARR